MEIKKRSHIPRKEILVADKLECTALRFGEPEDFSLRPAEEVFNICNANSPL